MEPEIDNGGPNGSRRWRLVDGARKIRTPWQGTAPDDMHVGAARFAMKHVNRPALDKLDDRHLPARFTRDGEWLILHSF